MSESTYINDSQREFFLTLLPLLDSINWSVQQLGPSFEQIERPFQHFQQSIHQIQQTIQKLQQSFQDFEEGFHQLYESTQELQRLLPPYQQLGEHLQKFQQAVARQIERMNEQESRRDKHKEDVNKSDTTDIEMSDV
ncbi:hypothetical protein HDV63DRAFT_375022 [Trichoderma sp. SZMC 28014]